MSERRSVPMLQELESFRELRLLNLGGVVAKLGDEVGDEGELGHEGVA